MMWPQALLCFTLTVSRLPFGRADSSEQLIFQDDRPVKNVAVIGAGSAGSSTAYYLRRYCDAAGFDVNITVFEREDYIGGRSTTVGVYDDEENPAELGASIFVEVNQNLVNATKAFNLSTEGLTRTSGDAPMLGIWNGKEFVFTQAPGGRGWWDNAKLLWKYGLAPVRTVNLMKSTVGKFLQMYEAPYFPWISLNQVVYDIGLQTVTAATGEQYLKGNSIGDLFANEIIQASTRVNYAQNLGLIHGLETMVCMATDGAMTIEGGNWQIFANMLKASSAKVLLETEVTSIERVKNGGYYLTYSRVGSGTTEDASSQVFDEVILAAPKQFSTIRLPENTKHIPDEIPYVALHVTLFTSKHRLSPTAFNLKPADQVPEIVLTTLPPGESHGSNTDGVGSAGFFSISTLRPTMDTRDGKDQLEYLYKIFSPSPPNSTFLAHILGLPNDKENDDGEIDTEDVSWIYRKLWHSYPYEYPRVTFEEIKLDDGLWYTSGIESFISTMETSSLMGKNVARLIIDGWELGNMQI